MKHLSKKRISIVLGVLVVGALAGTSVWYYWQHTPHLYEFELVRDKKDILDVFDRDWYWLIPGDRDSFSPELMMQYKAPQQNIMWAGRLSIKVLRKEDQFIGFVAYFMKTTEHGFLNFVDVHPDFRGKAYAHQMAQAAVNDMIARGAKKLTGITRPSNVRSRAMFKRLGFTEVREDETFVFMERMIQ